MAAADKTGVAGREPRSLSMLGLVKKFRSVDNTMTDRSFCFILGAGASVTSGIKAAGTMVNEWIDTLYRQTTNHTGPVPAGWASAATLEIEKFDPNDPAGSYSAIYRRMYEHDPDEGYAYLEEQMKHADPSFGYSVLGRILAKTRHRVVITVNFDNLVADSVSQFSDTYPLVCGHELLASFVSEKLRRPLVLKVHRDLLLGPKSTPEEIQKIDDGFREAIGRLLRNYTPIVIGYGGNDGSLMGCLEDLPANTIPGGMYWCYRDGSDPPPERIRKVVSKHKGHLVSIMGFDELLMQFGNELGYGVPDMDILDRAAKRAARIVQQAQELQERIKNRDDLAHMAATSSTKSDNLAREKDETAAVSSAMASTMQRKDGAKRWWQWEIEAQAVSDPAKRDEIYQAGLKELPNSTELRGNYANFLTAIRKDHDAAEAQYKRAIEADPKHANNLGNYAFFLLRIRKEQDAAEALFKRAIEADPKHAHHLGNYARFLTDYRNDADAAEVVFKQAIEADPKYANNLGSYATFLTVVRKDQDAAESLYKRAIEADPKHASSLGNYATFLTDVRKDQDAAESLYKRAIEADPKHASSLGNFAVFLTNIRKDQDAAEALFKRAIEADPKDANNLGNFATFLTRSRNEPDAAEAVFKQAIEADPKNANNLGSYATFLTVVRKDQNEAESLYKRAIESDPNHTNNLGNYSCLLLATGRVEDGLPVLGKALACATTNLPTVVHLECWMYAYCCWIALQRGFRSHTRAAASCATWRPGRYAADGSRSPRSCAGAPRRLAAGGADRRTGRSTPGTPAPASPPGFSPRSRPV
jgi:Tfp pilus assembly protein PilF